MNNTQFNAICNKIDSLAASRSFTKVALNVDKNKLSDEEIIEQVNYLHLQLDKANAKISRLERVVRDLINTTK